MCVCTFSSDHASPFSAVCTCADPQRLRSKGPAGCAFVRIHLNMQVLSPQFAYAPTSPLRSSCVKGPLRYANLWIQIYLCRTQVPLALHEPEVCLRFNALYDMHICTIFPFILMFQFAPCLVSFPSKIATLLGHHQHRHHSLLPPLPKPCYIIFFTVPVHSLVSCFPVFSPF